MIRKADGIPFDHVQEYDDAWNAVTKQIEGIKSRLNRLKSAGAVAGEEALLQDKLGDLSRLLDSYEGAAGGAP